LRRLSLLALAAAAVALTIPPPAIAFDDYRIEFSGTMGYTFSEGIKIQPFELPEDHGVLTGLDIKSGWSYGAGVDIMVTPEVGLGFNWSEQQAQLVGQLHLSGNRDITDMKVDNYHGTLTFHFPDPWRSATPYFLFGLGATQYRFTSFDGQSVSSDSRFSSTWGFGAKFHSKGALGLRLGARWTPTYIKSEPGGYWCNYYGCWNTSNLDYSNQFEPLASLLLRF
jgi:hypothetical protein